MAPGHRPRRGDRDAGLREPRDLAGERLRPLARRAVRDDAVAKSHHVRLLRGHLAPGEDEVERPAHPDEAR